jgi:nicotinate-nucleotide adenylyltransferase
VTGLESVIGTKYSCDTIAWLKTECPGVNFVWVMGADNLKYFHRWKKLARYFLPAADRGRRSRRYQPERGSGAAAMRFCPRAHPGDAGDDPAGREPPAWVYLRGIKSSLSSTALRAKKQRSGG